MLVMGDVGGGVVRGWVKGSVRGWWCWLHTCNFDFICGLVHSSLHSAYLFILLIIHQLVVFVIIKCFNACCNQDV